MSPLRKVESFLAKYAVLLKVLVALLWVLWAAQMQIPLRKSIELERTYYKNSVVYEIKRQAQWDYADYVVAITERAKHLGKNYTPEQYFADKKSIDEKKRAVEKKYEARVVDVSTMEMEEIIHANFRMDQGLRDRTAQAAAEYGDWARMGFAREKAKDEILKMEPSDIFKWILTLMLRGILLACALYLIRMSEREGIVQTISKSGQAFLRSVVLWPIYLWKYPFNVVKEIRIEAEFRRLGSVFRKLTAVEKIAVRTVASGNAYGEWITEFRIVQHRNLRRSLLVALIPAILLYVFPIHAQGDWETSIKNDSAQCIQIGNHCNKASPEILTLEITPSFRFEEPLLLLRRLVQPRERIPQGVRRKIDHVPLKFVICEI